MTTPSELQEQIRTTAGREPTCSAQEEPSRTAVAVSPAALLPVPDATTVRGLSCDAYFMSCDLPVSQVRQIRHMSAISPKR
jgi:hypothetical protein